MRDMPNPTNRGEMRGAETELTLRSERPASSLAHISTREKLLEPSFSERDHRRRLSTDVMTSIRFMALWLSLVLATLSYAAFLPSQGGEFRTDTQEAKPRSMQ
jgi:hypothetical protein